MRNLKFAVLFVLVFVGIACALEVEDYMPLMIGNSWTNQDSTIDGIDTTISEIIDTATMFGYLTYIFEDRTGEVIDTSYMQLRSDGIYGLNQVGDDGELMLMKMCANPFNIGDTWEVFTIDTSWEDTMGYTYYQHIEAIGEAETIEDVVTIPPMIFPDCVKLNITGEYDMVVVMRDETVYVFSGSMGEHSIWIAEGVGPVKSYDMEIEEDDTTEEFSVLIDYHISDIVEKRILPLEILHKVYPNPFNASVTISVLEGMGIEIFDLRGNVVAVSSELLAVGADNREFIWHPDESISSGIYLVRASLMGQTSTKRIVYLK